MARRKTIYYKKWNNKEIEQLNKYYSKMTVKDLQKKIFSNRTTQSITTMAKRCKIYQSFLPTTTKLISDKASDYERGLIIGLIEGEGSITLHRSYKSKLLLNPLITVHNNKKEIVNAAKNIIGGFISSRQSKDGKISYSLRLIKIATVYETLIRLKPYFISKNKQCDLLIEFCLSRMSINNAKNKKRGYTQKEIEISNKLKKLNNHKI